MRRSVLILVASLGLLQVGAMVALAPFATEALVDDADLLFAPGGFEEVADEAEETDCPFMLDVGEEESAEVDESGAAGDVAAVEVAPVVGDYVDEATAVVAPVEPRVEADAPAVQPR